MKLLDSRRLTGPSLLLDRPGAVIDVSLQASGPKSAEVVAAWKRNADALLDAVDWSDEETSARLWPGGASLAVTAPVDALYAATELNDRAWEMAVAELEGRAPSKPGGGATIEDLAAEIEREIATERDPALLALRSAASEHGVTFLMDDEQVSVGLGAGSLSWPVAETPDPGQVAWEEVYDIPLALVTGTNGKTTTVRLLATIAEAAGLVAGNTSTDGVQVDGEFVLTGDYTGPEGARTLLRDRRVELAILEVARGGMLRRGLPVTRADAAMVTNVAPDHLGDYGIQDVESLADAKMVVTRALRHNSRLVLNANDPLVVERATDPPCPVTWISGAPSEGPEDVATRLLAPHGVSLRDSDDVWLAVDENIVHAVGDSDLESRSFIRVDEIPITFGGAALFNIYNAIGAISLARALRLPDEAIREGLRSFKSTPEQNVGRLNVYDLGSVRAIVDFAHNPHGMESVFDMVGKLAPDRWLVTIGQAGDRDDEEIRELARLTWAARPDRVVIKELPKKLRGREPGEVPRLIEEELLSLGATAETIDHADSDFDAVRKALAWAQGGDLLLLLLHEDRTESLDLLDSLESEPAR